MLDRGSGLHAIVFVRYRISVSVPRKGCIVGKEKGIPSSHIQEGLPLRAGLSWMVDDARVNERD